MLREEGGRRALFRALLDGPVSEEDLCRKRVAGPGYAEVRTGPSGSIYRQFANCAAFFWISGASVTSPGDRKNRNDGKRFVANRHFIEVVFLQCLRQAHQTKKCF